MKKNVTINNQKEVFEFKTDGSYKRYLDWGIIGNSFQNDYNDIIFRGNLSPEHHQISTQILRIIENGEPLPNGVYDISSDIPSVIQFEMPPPKSRLNPVVISNWHIKSDMKIYQGQNLHSSRIRAVEGNVVCTESGNYYILVGRDPQIREIQNLLAPPGSPNDVYNSLNPLTPISIVQLLVAEKLVYGEAKHYASQLLTSLQQVKSSIETVINDTSPFEAIEDILRSIGITPDTIPYSSPILPLPLSSSSSSQLLNTTTFLPTPTLVTISYSIHHSNDILNGFPFTVYNIITLRELFLRLLYRHLDIFSIQLQLPEPFDGNLRIEWFTDPISLAQGNGGGWTPNDPEFINKQLNIEFGNRKLYDLQFQETIVCKILIRS